MVLVGDDSGDILMWIGKHLRQQIAIIEVLQVVDLIQSLLILKGKVLDLAHDALIFSEALPVLVVVVDIGLIKRRLIADLFKVVLFVSIAVRCLQSYCGAFREKCFWNLIFFLRELQPGQLLVLLFYLLLLFLGYLV